MPKQNFLLVSLEEEQSKQLAEVLSNPTSRKIIDYLSEKEEATESEISKVLTVPLSTIHYNLQKLKEAQLVHAEEFHYSKKGREVDHYKLANKYVIITPKPVKGIKSALRSILPVSLIVLGIAAIIELAQNFTQKAMGTSQELVRTVSTDSIALEAQMADTAVQVSESTNTTVWFLVGAFTAILLFIIINLLRRLRK